jgi:hypothetical protein
MEKFKKAAHRVQKSASVSVSKALCSRILRARRTTALASILDVLPPAAKSKSTIASATHRPPLTRSRYRRELTGVVEADDSQPRHLHDKFLVFDVQRSRLPCLSPRCPQMIWWNQGGTLSRQTRPLEVLQKLFAYKRSGPQLL